jgi:hypothetical protein
MPWTIESWWEKKVVEAEGKTMSDEGEGKTEPERGHS